MKIILASALSGIATAGNYVNNLFDVTITNTGYDEGFSEVYTHDTTTGGLNWAVTGESYTIGVQPLATDYIAVLQSTGLTLHASQLEIKYQLCVEHTGDPKPSSLNKNSCAQSDTVGNTPSAMWTSARPVDRPSIITLNPGVTTVHCDYDTSAGKNQYMVSIDTPLSTLTYGPNDYGGQITHSQSAESDFFQDIVRNGGDSEHDHFILTRPSVQENPTDACKWILKRSDDVAIHVRFLDYEDNIIQHSTLSAGITGAAETITFAGFDSTEERDMTEVASLGEESDVAVATYDALADDTDGATTADSTAVIAAGTFQVACDASLTKVSGNVIRNQLSVFKMSVSGCDIGGGSGAGVEVHWASLVDDYAGATGFDLTDCGDALTVTQTPHQAESLATTSCKTVYDAVGYENITVSTDTVKDKLAIFLSTDSAIGVAQEKKDVNTCVMQKTADVMGECTSGTGDAGVENAQRVSWAVAQYDHDSNAEQSGFDMYFYMVVSHNDTTRLDLEMELELDAEFKQNQVGTGSTPSP